MEVFGEDVVGEDGFINRRVLGPKVFADPKLLEKLNSIVWPAIQQLLEAEIKALGDASVATVFVEAAVLLEAGWNSMCDEVWVVSCSADAQLERLMTRNQLSREEALKRIDSQMPDGTRRAAASTLIETDGPRERLADAVAGAVAKSKLVAGTAEAAPSDEEIWHVDSRNNVVGTVPRYRMVRLVVLFWSVCVCVSATLTLFFF